MFEDANVLALGEGMAKDGGVFRAKDVADHVYEWRFYREAIST